MLNQLCHLSGIALAVILATGSGLQQAGSGSIPPTTAAATAMATSAIESAPAALQVCSFNIQFVGSSGRRDNAALAALVAPYDIVVAQELIASPGAAPAFLQQETI